MSCTVRSHVVLGAALAGAAGLLCALHQAHAQAQVPATTPSVQTGLPAAPQPAAGAAAPWAPPASFSEWASTLAYTGQVEGGIVGNPQDPNNGVNFGQLFTDKANRPILNQLLLTLERDIDPKATGYDVGVKLQGLYGSDARIVHSLGVFDHLIHDRNQIDVLEANISLHAPWLFAGGIDFKGGIYPTPLGFEVINALTNPFYSHSYIFDYGLPFKHLGLLSTSHVNSVLDVYFGIDTGNDTTLGSGDNNQSPAGIAGIGLTLLGGDLTVLALSHMGPENPRRLFANANSAMRYYNDIVTTYKPSKTLAFTTELNYVKDDGLRAEAYGASQYVAYTLSDTLTLNGRVEIFRDSNNAFVNTPVNNLDYVNAERGYVPANFYVSQGPTTYSEITAGVTYKPAGLPKQVSTLLVRPEIRYDRSLSGYKPFTDNTGKGSVTLAADIIAGF